MSAQTKVDQEMEKFRGLQTELGELSEKLQTFESQFNENKMVKKELELLTSGDKVYKLVGPVLLRQETEEAKTNVAKRIEFIQNELTKVSQLVADKEQETVSCRQGIASMQSEMQAKAVSEVQKIST